MANMNETPGALQDICVNYICENIARISHVHTTSDEGTVTRSFGLEEVYFHSNLSDQILAGLTERLKLDDDVMTLFDARSTCLKRVRIRNASLLTTRGLRILKPHKIIELESSGLKQITVNDLIGCLGEWTLSNLRSLNVSNSTFMNSAKFCVVVSLSKLKNLQSLNVSYTEFNKHGLDIIAEDLTSLESLDISGTPVNDLTPLRKCKSRLKSLTMYNLRSSHCENIVTILSELTNLRHLDVSDDTSVQPFVSLQIMLVKFKIADLLTRTDILPSLSSLDISGKEGITDRLIIDFMEAHPMLQFLGLALTNTCELPIFTDDEDEKYNPEIKVTGEATEIQIIEALKRYHNRPVFVQRSLYHLFTLTQQYLVPRQDIIKVILPAMRQHPKELSVQMAATACLYNLTKADMGQKVHPKWLSQVVDLTMSAMQNFPNHQQLQKNALLTLCSDRILQDVTFDRFRCATLVMDCLCSFDDQSMNRMSVAICGILAAKIPTDQTSQLGAKATYMKKLLSIVKDRTSHQLVDITMKFTLSALWNLTDESPSTCEMFLGEGGLELFMTVLDTYKNTTAEPRAQVETKVLGLINNLAEVKALRSTLMKEEIIAHIRELLKSPDIEVSYFAAGIVSHLASDGTDAWHVTECTRAEMLQALGEAVLRWEQPKNEMVAYRSFVPFFPLLVHYDSPQVQLWAVWAMQHVCTKNAQRYCPMLVKEGGANRLLNLTRNIELVDGDVNELATNVLSIIDKEVGTAWHERSMECN